MKYYYFFQPRKVSVGIMSFVVMMVVVLNRVRDAMDDQIAEIILMNITVVSTFL